LLFVRLDVILPSGFQQAAIFCTVGLMVWERSNVRDSFQGGDSVTGRIEAQQVEELRIY